jgi:hypothetical protein
VVDVTVVVVVDDVVVVVVEPVGVTDEVGMRVGGRSCTCMMTCSLLPVKATIRTELGISSMEDT